MTMTREWFTERIGRKVIRTNTYDNSETEFEITVKNAGYLYLFTLKGYIFQDVAPTASTVSEMETVDSEAWLEAARPKVRLHVAMNGDGTNSKMCVGACEG